MKREKKNMSLILCRPVNTQQLDGTSHCEYSCASQHLCLHLCIFVSHLCSQCYWTKASGSTSDKWCLALVWTAHQMRQKSRNHIWYSSPPCPPLVPPHSPHKAQQHNWHQQKISSVWFSAVRLVHTFDLFCPLLEQRPQSDTFSGSLDHSVHSYKRQKTSPRQRKKNMNSAALWSMVDELSQQPPLHLKPSRQTSLLRYYHELGSKAIFGKLQHCCKNLCWCRINKVSIMACCLKTFFELGVIPWQE